MFIVLVIKNLCITIVLEISESVIIRIASIFCNVNIIINNSEKESTLDGPINLSTSNTNNTYSFNNTC